MNPIVIYIFLALTIIFEVTATFSLKLSNGWEKWWLGTMSVILYCLTGIVFSIVLKHMSTGLAYSICSGAGIALVCFISVYFGNQVFDNYAIAGVLCIVFGTLLITAKSTVVLQ